MTSLDFISTKMDRQSPLINPQDYDYILREKLQMANNTFDKMHAAQDHKMFNQTSQDFVVLLCNNVIRLNKVLGLRNYQ
jgi:hypothetical protein